MKKRTYAKAIEKRSSVPAPSQSQPALAARAPEEPQPDIATQRASAARLGHSFGAIGVSRAAPVIQAKLTVGAPSDKYEDEADQIAGQVMRMSDADVQRQPIAGAPGEKADEGDTMAAHVMRKADADGSFDTGDDVEQRIAASKGGGAPLPEHTRAFMEPRFGADFGGVRVHADGEAHQLNQDLSARAFTTGQDIFFKQGEYDPSGASGKELLAHELTHVVQQTGIVQRMLASQVRVVSQPLIQRKWIVKKDGTYYNDESQASYNPTSKKHTQGGETTTYKNHEHLLLMQEINRDIGGEEEEEVVDEIENPLSVPRTLYRWVSTSDAKSAKKDGIIFTPQGGGIPTSTKGDKSIALKSGAVNTSKLLKINTSLIPNFKFEYVPTRSKLKEVKVKCDIPAKAIE